jgi:hypothetical protein
MHHVRFIILIYYNARSAKHSVYHVARRTYYVPTTRLFVFNFWGLKRVVLLYTVPSLPRYVTANCAKLDGKKMGTSQKCVRLLS